MTLICIYSQFALLLCNIPQQLVNSNIKLVEMSLHPIGNICISQLKILLDQVEEAVGDFDECIKLRPDSALAQAQKCFALVSTTGRLHLYAGTVLEAVCMR